ncbi:ankyrin repeat-containing domain protein [Copromyces sp. CBS 386.78]|nr:ankyrin repeat-containing domain protein [Copromyces sp. CBS 386.78]
MPSISALPTELVVLVINDLHRLTDLAALARTNKRFYDVVNPVLYKRAVSENFPYPLEWAAHNGVVGTLIKALDSGADPNYEFQQSRKTNEWEKALAGKSQLHPGWDAASVSDSSSTLPAGSNGSSHRVRFASPGDEDASMSGSSDDSDGDTDDSLADAYYQAKFARRYTALHLAARAGHVQAISTLLERGARIDVVSRNLCSCGREHGILNPLEGPFLGFNNPGWTPLHVAICHFKEEAALQLLASGAPIQMELNPPWERSGYHENPATALHHAAGKGLVRIIRYLVDTGLQSDMNVRDNQTLTPFYYAYADGRWESLPLLLLLGANINVDVDIYLPYSTITPLGEACLLGNYASALWLIGLGADVNRGYISTDVGKGLTPLHLCAVRPGTGRSPHAVTVARSPFIEDYTREVEQALVRVRMIKKLVSCGAALEATDCSDNTPLMAAVKNLYLPAVRALIQAGANVHATNSLGRNVLMQAIDGPPMPLPVPSSQDIDVGPLTRVLRELLNNGAKIDHRDKQGNTILHIVCEGPYRVADQGVQLDVLRLVLDIPGAPALMHVRNTPESLTPLMVAFMEDRYRCCDVLVRRGCWANLDDTKRKEDLTLMANHCYKLVTIEDSYARLLLQQRCDYLLDLDIDGHLSRDPKFCGYILFHSERGIQPSSLNLFDPQRPTTAAGSRLYDHSMLLRGPEEVDADVFGTPLENMKGWCAPKERPMSRPIRVTDLGDSYLRYLPL